jgi:hypothetical protein
LSGATGEAKLARADPGTYRHSRARLTPLPVAPRSNSLDLHPTFSLNFSRLINLFYYGFKKLQPLRFLKIHTPDFKKIPQILFQFLKIKNIFQHQQTYFLRGLGKNFIFNLFIRIFG